VATAETEGAWVRRALQLNSRELEDLVARASRGDAPPDPAEEWEPPRHIWARFRLDPFHFERLMQALALLRHQLDDPDMSASQLLLYMAELCLDGDLLADEGGASDDGPDPEGFRNAASEDGHATAHGCGEDAEDEGTQPKVHVCGEDDTSENAPPTAHVCGKDNASENVPPTAHVCGEDAASENAPSAAHVCCDDRAAEDTRPTAQVYRGANEDSDHGEHLPQQLPRGENAYSINYRIIEHRCPCCQKDWTEGRAGREIALGLAAMQHLPRRPASS